MQTSYTRSYLKIYTFQFISVILGIISLFIVTPYLSANKYLFGIYSICISLTIYFSYADLGFITAGQKFAAESYAQGNKNMESRIVSFTGFVLFLFMGCVSLIILLFAYNPHWLIKGLLQDSDVKIARSLLCILAFSSPILMLQRILNIIFSIRMEDYKYQKFLIAGNIIKILLVLVFFTHGRYMIVPYYLCFQLVTLLVTCCALIYVRNHYKYDFLSFISNMKFDHEVFWKLKDLAFASLFSMICWILYYELDQIVIGKLSGPEMVSVYAIAFSVLALFRTFLGVIYTPFSARFNHFAGQKDFDGLNHIFLFTTRILLPCSVLPIITLALLSKPFLYSWVGEQYEQAIALTSILVCCNLFAFFTYPGQAFITAMLKNKSLYVAAALNVFVYWAGIVILYHRLGLSAFAWMKVVAFYTSACFYFIVITKIVHISRWNYLGGILRRSWLPVLCCVILCIWLQPHMFYEKNTISLLKNILIIGGIVGGALIISVFTFPEIKNYLLKLKNMVGLDK